MGRDLMDAAGYALHAEVAQRIRVRAHSQRRQLDERSGHRQAGHHVEHLPVDDVGRLLRGTVRGTGQDEERKNPAR